MMSAGEDVILEASAVSKAFTRRRGLFTRASVTVVRDVSLELREGEILGLVGESGSGKTTLSRMLLGAMAPTSGQVRLRGQCLRALTPLQRAREVQMVYQDPYSSLNPARTVASVLQQVLRTHGVAREQEQQRRIGEALDLVGLSSRHAQCLPRELSGGQRQRVVIARALILRPKILICDEPTSALDVSIQAQILNLLLDIRSQLQLSYLFVSHNLAVVEHLADRVAVMYGGRIVEMAGAEDLFRRPRHPYSHLLSTSINPAPFDIGAAPDRKGSARAASALPEDDKGCVFLDRCPNAGMDCRINSPPLITFQGSLLACHHPNERSAAAEQQ